MLPLGHLALAYLLYVAAARLTQRPLPAIWALPPLAVGSQFPDLIDKPLAYYNLVTYGRSFAHSIVTTIIVCSLLWLGARKLTHTWDADSWQNQLRLHAPLAFTVGYSSHLLGDAWRALTAGHILDLRFLLWPIYRIPATPADDIPPWLRLIRIYQEMETHPQLELIIAATLVLLGLRLHSRLAARP